MIRDYFRTRRQLNADNATLRALVDEKDAQIRDAGEAIAHAQDAYQRARNLAAERQADLRIANDQVRRLAKERDELRQQNIRVRNALHALRDDITREERAALFGMARPLDRPIPWKVADAIAEETAAKRAADI